MHGNANTLLLGLCVCVLGFVFVYLVLCICFCVCAFGFAFVYLVLCLCIWFVYLVLCIWFCVFWFCVSWWTQFLVDPDQWTHPPLRPCRDRWHLTLQWPISYPEPAQWPRTKMSYIRIQVLFRRWIVKRFLLFVFNLHTHFTGGFQRLLERVQLKLFSWNYLAPFLRYILLW